MEYSENVNLNESQIALKEENLQNKDSLNLEENGRSSLILDSQKKRRSMLSPRNHPISPFEQPNSIEKPNSPITSHGSIGGARVSELPQNRNKNVDKDEEGDNSSQIEDIEEIESHKSKNMGGKIRERVESHSDCQSSEGKDVMILNLSEIKLDKELEDFSLPEEVPLSPIKLEETPGVSEELPPMVASQTPERKYSNTPQKPVREQRQSIVPTPFSNIENAVNQLANDNSFLIDKPEPRLNLSFNFISKMKNSILVNREGGKTFYFELKERWFTGYEKKEYIELIIKKNSENTPTKPHTHLRFVNKLKMLIQYQRYRLLTSNQLQRIGDTTFYSSGMVENGAGQQREYGKLLNFFLLQLTRMRRKILKLERKTSRLFEEVLPAINPDNNLIIIWWIFLLLCIFLEIFIVPYKLSFDLDYIKEGINEKIFFLVPASIFLFDIILSFNVAYYNDDLLIVKKSDIAKNYLGGKFFIDLVATLSIWLSNTTEEPILDAFFFFRFFQINEIIRFIDERFELEQRFNTVFECSKLVVFILIMAHIFGCGFHLIARLEIEAGSEDTWVQKIDMENSGNGERYIAAIYYTIVTMITIGYGDITPNNSYERIYAMVMMIFTTFAFGYTVNKISTLFSSRAAAEQEFLKKKYSLSKFLADKDLPHELCTKLYKNLESLHQKQSDGQELGSSIFSSLHIEHQLEYKKEFFGRILANQKLLTQNFSVEAMHKVALLMEEKNLSAGEHLFVQGQYDSRVFIIVKGSLQLLHNATGRAEVPVAQLPEGRILGLADGMRNAARRVSARAQQSGTQVVFFHLEEFVRTLKKSTVVQDYEIYCNMRQEVTFNDEHSEPGQGYECECCGQFAHTLEDCPLIHFNANRSNLFSKHTYSQILKERERIERREIGKETRKAVLEIDDVRDKLVSIRKYYTELPLEYEDLSDPEDDKEFYFIYPKIKGNRIRQSRNGNKSSIPLQQRDLHKSLILNEKKNSSHYDSQENGEDNEVENERKIVFNKSQSFSDSSSSESDDMTFFITDTENSESSESESEKKDTDSIISILQPRPNKNNAAQGEQQLHPHLSLNAVGQQNILSLINSTTQISTYAPNEEEPSFGNQYLETASAEQLFSKVEIEGVTNVPANTITQRKSNKSPKNGTEKEMEDSEDGSNNVFDSAPVIGLQQQMQEHSSLQNSSENNIDSETSVVLARPAPGDKRRGSVFKLMMNKMSIPNAKEGYKLDQQDSPNNRYEKTEKNKEEEEKRRECEKSSSKYIEMSSQLETIHPPDISPESNTFIRQKSKNKSALMHLKSFVDPVLDHTAANYFSIPNFEEFKSYKWFQPQHNIELVLKKTERYLASYENETASQRDLANRSPEAIMARSSVFYKTGSPKRLQVTLAHSYQPQPYQKKRYTKIFSNSKGELQA